MSDTRIVHVIDDDDALRDSVRLFLVNEGLNVRTYASATEFLSALEDGPVGCVVTDIRMPGMSGMELLSHLSARSLSVPVIVVTGHADVPLAVRAMKQGAVDLLEKPFRADDLIDAIRNALDFRQRVEDERGQYPGSAGAAGYAQRARNRGARPSHPWTAEQDHRLRNGDQPKDR